VVRGDGNGWTVCSQGHQHWGVHGAAGLLLRSRDAGGLVRILLQHRAAWTSNGDTWGLPGGARDSHESPREAALREAAEEAGIAPGLVRVLEEVRDDHGGWCYVTVIAEAPEPLSVVPNAESVALRWVAESAVDDLDLHPGFALTWPLLRTR
jgi:8-oxo-dGTP diphosphatase